MIIPRPLLFLLVLVPYLEASSQATVSQALGPEGFAKSIVDGITTLALNGPSDSPSQAITLAKPSARSESIGRLFAEASGIYMKKKDSKIGTIARELDKRIGELKGEGCGDDALAAIPNRFVEVNPEELLSAALEIKATHLLRTLQYLYIWETAEQYHLFLAHVYEMKDCYVENAWKGGPVPMDWGKHWKTIFMADNPKLLVAIRSGKVPTNPPFALSKEQILDLAIEYDSLEIFKSLNLEDSIETLKSRLAQLAEWGDVNLLKYLLQSGKVGTKLHLENYPFLKKFPKNSDDFFFFFNHGYDNFPRPKVQLAACEAGELESLDALSRIDRGWVSLPPPECAAAAAKGGYLDILKWLKKHTNNFSAKNAALAAAQNGKFEVLEWLKEECACVPDQDMANAAFSHNQLKMAKLIHDEAGILPDASTIGDSSVGRFTWILSIDPNILTSELLACANTDILEHLWEDPQKRGFFSDEIKEKQAESIRDRKKLRLIFKIWERLPKVIDWDIPVKDLEEFAWAFKEGRMAIAPEVANVAAASGDFTRLKRLEVYYPLCLTKDIISVAVKNGHFEIAKHFNPKMNPEREFIELDMKIAYERNDVEMLQWALDNCKYMPPQDWFDDLPYDYNEHLDTFEWLVRIGYITANNFQGYRQGAYNDDYAKIFNYLHKQFGHEGESIESFFRGVWNARATLVKLDVFKEIMPALSPREIEYLLSSEPTPRNALAHDWLLRNKPQEDIAK